LNLIPLTNLCFIFSLRQINPHQLSPQKDAEICLSLALCRFWPWLPRKSSHLFSQLLSQPSNSFTSFLPPNHPYIFPIQRGSSFYPTFPSPPSPHPPPSLHNPPHPPLIFPDYKKAFFLSIIPPTQQFKSTSVYFSPSKLCHFKLLFPIFPTHLWSEVKFIL
jgi:hypothetical protein